MATERAITILHLSDLQFGRNHRFGRLGLPPPDDQFDTLFNHLRDDLNLLKQDYSLRPDILIVTGDLAEWGQPKEFADARDLLVKLSEHLELSRDRVVIVPGNHDINRDLCEAYFLRCKSAGTDQKPLPPFTPKWEYFLAMFREFYKDQPNIRFTIEEPWTWFEIPELKVVIAGLNSTMAECHDISLPNTHPWFKDYAESGRFGHFGWCGEAQLHSFATSFEIARMMGWLRVGAVHHNFRRGDTADDENLRDANDLGSIIGGSLNLLLHGHTHDGKIDRMPNGVPILSTGSAALTEEGRPKEAPNQYQIIRIQSAKLERFTRCFDPREKKWIGDNRSSAKGDIWHTEDTVSFDDVHETFPAEKVTVTKTVDPDRPERKRLVDDRFERPDDFLTRVAEVCRHRKPAAEVTPIILPEPRIEYLRVVEKHDGFVRQYPVGVFERLFTEAQLQLFLDHVDAKYRANDPALNSEIVYGGNTPLSEALRREAERRRIKIQSFVEFQGLIDFTPYVQKQTGKLERDEIYPPSLYVPQRMRFHVGQDESLVDDALVQVQEWLVQPHPRFVLILGDFGTGKTFLLHELARRMGNDGTGLTPLFIELRALEKAQTLDALVAQHLAKSGVDRIDLPAFRYMLQQGRIVLFFDGFDELALRVSYDRAAEHFDTLVQAAGGDAKVVVTSRTQHFESDKHVRTVLYDRAQPLPGLRYCKLQPFTGTQIKRFLINRWGNEKEADHWFGLISHVKDLLGLSENPRMLGFITELKKEDIARAKQKEGVISAADLYRLLLERWLVFEYDRAHPPGSQITLTREARWAAVTAVALRLWEKTEKFVTAAEIAEGTSAAVAKLMTTPPPADIAGHLIGSGSLLRRDDEGCFFFVHQSVMEWLVASEAAEQIKQTRQSSLLGSRVLSPLMAEFLCDLAGHDAMVAWAGGVAGREAAGADVIKNNALEVLKRLGKSAVLNLAGQDLRGREFADQDLRGADLRGADLTDARLRGKDLSGAWLDGAKLLRADFTKAVLARASLVKTDFSEARLLGADLRGAAVQQSVWRRAKLIAAHLDDGALAGLDCLGAALPTATIAEPMQSPVPVAPQCVTWSPDGSLLVSGHDAGAIRLWDAASGKPLREFLGHQGTVRSVAFSPDGKWLASGSDDKTVQLWDASGGKPLHEFRGHQGSIWSVAFSPGGKWLVSGSDDNTVRLWDAASGKPLREFLGHQGSIRSVAFSPDGKWLASGSADRTVRLWDAASGKLLREFLGHQGYIRSVAFSPGGKWLASGSGDNTVRLWDAASGKPLREFLGHRDWVRSVAFSPGGKWLASGSDDNTVRLWDAASGKPLREFLGHQGYIRSVAFSPGGKWLASGSADRTVRLWDAASGKPLREFLGHQGYIRSVAFSPDGEWLASGSADNTVRLWDAASGKPLREFLGHRDWVWSVAFSPGGKWLASGSDDKTVRLWDAASGKPLREFQGHQGTVRSVAFSPGGKWLASGSADKTVRLWDAASGKLLREFQGHQGSIRNVAFSPDGKWLASASGDNTVRLWDAASGKPLREFQGHQGSIWSVVFSPDGKWLASGSADNTVRLWDAASGGLRVTLAAFSEGWVAFTQDGRHKYSGSLAGNFWFVIGLCRFEPGELDEFLPSVRAVALDEPLIES